MHFEMKKSKAVVLAKLLNWKKYSNKQAMHKLILIYKRRIYKRIKVKERKVFIAIFIKFVD